ncbi:hypothetical protein HZI73_22350 [Vallitalea pronyensis]|uniref:Uncharacterized protein n=1 Tax=Vallitalea pronyensis TaxID=1348613 RepID=A0A8J8MP95_9FIRM|nr:hypothetical protein [Vallitalea pronyensis]QUI24873.1 hypothetical protein HZI73_22350 [Vallitalea pronyensis]
MAGILTTEQIASVVLDAGVVYIDYKGIGEKILAPTRGGNEFKVEQTFKEVSVDGQRGKTKGMRRIVTEDASLKVRLMGLTQENLKLALPGADLDSTTKAITNGGGKILDADYIPSITLVVPNMAGNNKVITLYNALHDGGLTMATTDKDEVVVELVFYSHREPTDSTVSIYKMEEVTT